MADGPVRGVDALLSAARERIERLTPHEAWAAASAGEALIVDIRSDTERERAGIVPGSIHIPRTVLEWRVDPSSAWSNPHVGNDRLLLICSHGLSSSLAAATLVDLGFDRAGYVVGGIDAWLREELPLRAVTACSDGVAPGMGGQDY